MDHKCLVGMNRYKSRVPLSDSGAYGSSYRLGNLVIYNPYGATLWASNTSN